MNVLLAAGPESTTLFTITVQGSGRPPARLAGQRHIMVPLNRLQVTYRRLLLAGDTILSITRCGPVDDPPPSPATVPQAEETALPQPMEQPPEQLLHQRQGEASIEEDVIVLLLSVLGVVILLTFQVAQYLAQQWVTRSPGQQRPHPSVAGAQERGDWPTVKAATRAS